MRETGTKERNKDSKKKRFDEDVMALRFSDVIFMESGEVVSDQDLLTATSWPVSSCSGGIRTAWRDRRRQGRTADGVRGCIMIDGVKSDRREGAGPWITSDVEEFQTCHAGFSDKDVREVVRVQVQRDARRFAKEPECELHDVVRRNVDARQCRERCKLGGTEV